jgi:hypothetical protein
MILPIAACVPAIVILRLFAARALVDHVKRDTSRIVQRERLFRLRTD